VRFGRRFAPRPFTFGLIVRRAAQVIALLVLAYMAALNLLLVTPLLRYLASRTGRALHIEYTRAYALLPWRVHAEGLTLRGGDSHVEWLLAIDEVSFGFDPLPLLHRHFHASSVSASGVSVRARLLESAPSSEHDAHLPPIPGFADPPLKPIGPSQQITDADYHLFTVDLENVDAQHVREVWVDTLRFNGDMRVQGRWDFRPMRHLEVGPAGVDVGTLDVSYGMDVPYVVGASGRFGATIHPFDVRVPSPIDILHYISIDTDLTGTLHANEAFRAYAPPSARAVALSGEASFVARLLVSHGVVDGASVFNLKSPDVGALFAGRSARSALDVSLHVERDKDVATGVADVSLSGVRFGTPALTEITADAVHAALRTETLDLAAPSRDILYDLTLVGALAPRVDPWSYLLPSGSSMHGGPVRGHGHFAGSLTDETASGTAELDAQALQMRAGALEMTGNANLALRGKVATGGSSFDLTGTTLSLEHVESGGVSDWWAKGSLQEASVQPAREGPHGRFDVRIDARDAKPAEAFVEKVSGVPKWVLDIFSIPNLHAQGELRFAPERLDLRGLDIHGGSTLVRIELAKHASSTRGLVLAEHGALVAGFGLGEETPKLVLFGAKPWFEARKALIERE
jgi:hypothetical protein